MGRENLVVEVLEVGFVGELSCGEMESEKNGVVGSVLSFFDLFFLWPFWLVSRHFEMKQHLQRWFMERRNLIMTF